MKIEFENAGALAYLMGEFANIIRNTEKNSENSVCNMTFGQALEALKEGKKVARSGWNGKSQYIELATNISYINADLECINVNHDSIGNKAIAFVGTSGVQLGWLASQADMLADDWIIIE